MDRFPLLLIALLAHTPLLQAGNFPAWRGPAGNGHIPEKDVPLRWSAAENVQWKVALPSPGNSTPIVWQDRIFLTGSLDKGARRTLTCFDRADGRELWQREATIEAGRPTHKTNPHGSSSPVTDGQRVVAWHGSAGIAAYDFDGRELWRKDVGKFTHIWGYASSPILVDGLAIVSCGPGLRCFLIALDKTTGEEVWRRDLPEAESEKPDQFKGSWSTPVVRDTGAGKEVVLSLPKRVIGFDPKTGEQRWSCGGLSDLVYTSPVIGEGVVVAMSGYTGPAIACRLGGRGDVTESHRLWRHAQKNPQRIGSGVIVDGHVYLQNEPGITTCIELQTGEEKWKQRLGGKTWASMSYVDGRLYFITRKSETFVLAPNPESCEVLARNPLDGETTCGSLAFSDGEIFVRSHGHLYCIGE